MGNRASRLIGEKRSWNRSSPIPRNPGMRFAATYTNGAPEEIRTPTPSFVATDTIERPKSTFYGNGSSSKVKGPTYLAPVSEYWIGATAMRSLTL